MKKKEQLPVIFRMEKCCGEWEPLAVFPTTEWGDNGYRFMTCLCYRHIGQHNCICHDYYSEKTKPATKEQYEPLLKELTNVAGYVNLRIVKKWMSHYAD